MKRFIFLCLLTLMAYTPVQAVPSLSASPDVQAQHESFSFLKPLKKQLVKWNTLINREIPKRMKALKDNPSPAILLSSLLAALAYGVLHTLGPGHGKMVVATYFLTHGAQFWRGSLVGVQVAFSHVAGAVFLVFATDIAMRQLLTDPTAQIFWVRSISYSLIILIGIFMLIQAIRHGLGQNQGGATCGHCNHGHNTAGHTKRETIMSWCVGAIPCTGSLLILLYAMAHNMLWLGLAMVLLIAIGMALAMIAIGWLCILGKQKIIDRYFNRQKSGHIWQIGLEVLGALAIVSIGTLLLLTVVS